MGDVVNASRSRGHCATKFSLALTRMIQTEKSIAELQEDKSSITEVKVKNLKMGILDRPTGKARRATGLTPRKLTVGRAASLSLAPFHSPNIT